MPTIEQRREIEKLESLTGYVVQCGWFKRSGINYRYFVHPSNSQTPSHHCQKVDNVILFLRSRLDAIPIDPVSLLRLHPRPWTTQKCDGTGVRILDANGAYLYYVKAATEYTDALLALINSL